jgi:hypothetical protein
MSSKNGPFDPSTLDGISLTQALKDFETANARVLDLTQRLLESERQRKSLANELEHLRLQLAEPPAATLARSLGVKLARNAVQSAKGARERARGLAQRAKHLLGS